MEGQGEACLQPRECSQPAPPSRAGGEKMEGLGWPGEVVPDTWAPTLTEECSPEQRDRAQTADSGYASTLTSRLLLYSPCATSASQADIMFLGSAQGPEGGSNTVPRRGKRRGEGLATGPGGAWTPARRDGGSGQVVTLGGIELYQRSGGEDSVLGIHRDIHEGQEALLGPGERVTQGRGSEDSGKDVLLEPGQGVTHGRGSDGPGLQEDTGSERTALEPDKEGGSAQLLEWTGPEARGDNQNGGLAQETEQQSPLLTPGPEASHGASQGNQSWMRKLLPPTEISSSPWFLVPCALVLLLLIAVAALLGRSLSQDTPVPPRYSPCPMDWLYSRHRCYYFSMMYRKEGDWDESQRVCSSHNGSLALFDTQDELNFLLHICSVKHMWVGLQKSGSGIQWANGTACSSSLCKVEDSGDCAYIQDDALWVSGCDLKRPYICTKETYL